MVGSLCLVNVVACLLAKRVVKLFTFYYQGLSLSLSETLHLQTMEFDSLFTKSTDNAVAYRKHLGELRQQVSRYVCMDCASAVVAASCS